jgi:hypothetical protein
MTTCTSYLQGLVIRATKLDACGAPVAGTCSTVVSKGFISLELETDEASGNEIAPTLADGTRCYYHLSPKQLNGIKANIEFCSVDPDLFNLLTGAPLVLDDTTPTPQSIGFVTDSASYGVANVALELWMNLKDGGCADASGRKWGYYLMPWLHQGTVGKPTIENDAVNFTVSEAITRDGNQWGVGPYNIQLDNASVPSPLFTALASTVHDLLMPVNLAPPTPVCGCQELIIPT